MTGIRMKFLRIVLLPFIPVYAVIIWIRNFLFDKNVFKSRSVDARIISVGNVTVGGSGKTPVTIYITELLKSAGAKVGVLSRGYRRKTRGYVLVSDGQKILTEVDRSGDEIYHTVLDCQVPAAVCENRVKGARRLIEDTAINTIVLDDAFQHRWINRDLDIVVVDQHFLSAKDFFTKCLLPAGNLREPFGTIKRADAIIVNRKFLKFEDFSTALGKILPGKKIFSGYYKAINFVDLKKHTEYELNEFEGQKSLVVSGIAKPQSFINVLSLTNVDTENRLIFRDHKEYNYDDVQLIRKKFYSTNSHSVVTTEKDAVKLTNFSIELDDIDIFYLKIKFKIDDEDSFKHFIFAD